MQTYNAAARVERNAEFGAVWVEKITNTQGSFEAPKYSAVRVRAAAACTVSLDGVLAATLTTGEILILNTGRGNGANESVTVTIATGNAFVQLATE